METAAKAHTQVEMGSNRNFGFVFATFFLIVFSLSFFKTKEVRLWPLALSLTFLLTTLFCPQLLSPLNKLWFLFGNLIGKIVSPIVLSLLYFATILPTGLILKALGKDLLHLRKTQKNQSAWIPKSSHDSSMKNQF